MLKVVFLFLCLFSMNSFGVDLSAIRTLPEPGTVALTFNDGPVPGYTDQILSILKNNNIKATFFVIGANAEKYPELVKAIHQDGHVVAQHAHSHVTLTKVSSLDLQDEIEKPAQIIANLTGMRPKCLRYPFGASNQHVRDQIRVHGMLPVPMGFNSFDGERPGVEKIVDWVLKNVHSRQVILLHDGFERLEQTIAALPLIIEGIKKKGLGFSTICG